MDAGASLRQCVVVSNALAYRTPYYLGYKLKKTAGGRLTHTLHDAYRIS